VLVWPGRTHACGTGRARPRPRGRGSTPRARYNAIQVHVPHVRRL